MEGDHIIVQLMRKYKPEFEIKTVENNGILELLLEYGENEPLAIPLDDSVKWCNVKKIMDALIMIKGIDRQN